MSMTFTPQPIPITRNRPTEPAEDRRLSGGHRRPVILPPRFDVYRVADVLGRLDSELAFGDDVRIDGSQVQMIDLAAIESLRALLGQHPGLRIERPSVALRVTVEFTRADAVAESFAAADVTEAA